MKVAAYQAMLADCQIENALVFIREQVVRCESLGVELLCCPEAVLGGLADYAADPHGIAIDVEGGQLNDMLMPLASKTVTTIVGFTELSNDGQLYNSAAVYHGGSVLGVYRKLHPAVNRSVYAPGHDMPVFTVGALTFGIVICRDSAFPEPARVMASRGATALFIPTNNGMLAAKGGEVLAAEARRTDIQCAVANGMSVIRADVAGRDGPHVSFGSSAIISREGVTVATSRALAPELLIAEIDVGCPSAAVTTTGTQ